MKQNIFKKAFQSFQKKRVIKTNFQRVHNLIEEAFTIGGKTYYQFKDFHDMPAQRALKTCRFYEEFKSNITADILRLHCLAIQKLLKEVPVINMFTIHRLNERLLERLDKPIDFNLVYKLASIIFFDSEEDITDYSPAYNQKKIAEWKKNELNTFLQLKSIREIAPIIAEAGDMRQYEKVSQQLDEMHLAELIKNLPAKEIEKLTGKTFFESIILPQN